MKKSTNLKVKNISTPNELKEGLKRKGDKCKENHPEDPSCGKDPNAKESIEFSLNEHEVTSSYSNNDAIQREAIEFSTSGEEFSSLIYMSKRINQETHSEYLNKFMSQLKEQPNDTKNEMLEETKCNFASVAECLEVIKRNVPQIDTPNPKGANLNTNSETETNRSVATHQQQDALFSFSDGHAECVSALKFLYNRTYSKLHDNLQAKSEALITDNDNIQLYFDLEDEHSREFLVTLSEVTLPEIYTLKIVNFYESDEDLERFMIKSLSSVGNFVFISESFGVDIHDYLTSILKITGLKNLYLKGFMIDGEDGERIFSSTNVQGVTFESGNLGIDEDFELGESQSQNSSSAKSILSKIGLVDDETTKETINILLTSIKRTSVRDSLKGIELKDGEIAPKDVKDVVQTLGLNIIVQ